VPPTYITVTASAPPINGSVAMRPAGAWADLRAVGATSVGLFSSAAGPPLVLPVKYEDDPPKTLSGRRSAVGTSFMIYSRMAAEGIVPITKRAEVYHRPWALAVLGAEDSRLDV
jgi:hypothetical protein